MDFPLSAVLSVKPVTSGFRQSDGGIVYETKIQKNSSRHLIPAFACALLFLFGGFRLYFTPTVEISIDINPSVELGVNRFNRVVSLEGFNEDGRELAASLQVQHLEYSAAVNKILESESISRLLEGDEILTISVIGTDSAQSREIFSCMQSCTAEQSNMYCYYARPEEVEKAHEAGLSYGKYRAFLELKALYPDITPEDVRQRTMREIREWIEALSSGGGTAPKSSGNTSGTSGLNGQERQYRRGRESFAPD